MDERVYSYVVYLSAIAYSASLSALSFTRARRRLSFCRSILGASYSTSRPASRTILYEKISGAFKGRDGYTHDFVVVHDGLQTMSDSDDSDIARELVAQR